MALKVMVDLHVPVWCKLIHRDNVHFHSETITVIRLEESHCTGLYSNSVAKHLTA